MKDAEGVVVVRGEDLLAPRRVQTGEKGERNGTRLSGSAARSDKQIRAGRGSRYAAVACADRADKRQIRTSTAVGVGYSKSRAWWTASRHSSKPGASPYTIPIATP